MTENLYKPPYKSSSNTWLFLFYPNVIFFALTELKKKSAYCSLTFSHENRKAQDEYPNSATWPLPKGKIKKSGGIPK